jgi:hypothetical protein
MFLVLDLHQCLNNVLQFAGLLLHFCGQKKGTGGDTLRRGDVSVRHAGLQDQVLLTVRWYLVNE